MPEHLLCRPVILLSDPHVLPKLQNTRWDWIGKRLERDPIRQAQKGLKSGALGKTILDMSILLSARGP